MVHLKWADCMVCELYFNSFFFFNTGHTDLRSHTSCPPWVAAHLLLTGCPLSTGRLCAPGCIPQGNTCLALGTALGTRSSHQVTPPSRSCHSTASPTPTLCTRGTHGVCTRQSGMVITSAASRCQCRAPAAQVAATPGDGPVAMGSQSGSPTWTDVCQLPKILSLLTPAWVLHPAS